MNKWTFLTGSFALLFLIGCGGSSGGDDNPPTPVVKSTLLVYMTGSDLEENFDLASTDLLEMIEGYQRLGEAEQSDFNVFVAFGGAGKDGWRGIRYADMDCIIKDSQDKEFGNDSCYAYEDKNANMGDVKTLENFLRFNENVVNGSERNYLIFWNHGAAYKGVCLDSVHTDILSVHELDQSLGTVGKKFDLIGMDACLMGSIEVVKGIQKYADYYVGSEATIPGHGWDYRDVMYLLGRGGDLSVEARGRGLVDSFLDSPNHQESENKTLALMDLSKTGPLLDALDAVVYKLDVFQDFTTIGNSAYQGKNFGVSSDKGSGVEMDLRYFSHKLSVFKPSIELESRALSAKVDDFVVYARGETSECNGVTIFQPLDDDDWRYYDAFGYAATTAWHDFVEEFTTTRKADEEAPKIYSEQPCLSGMESGYCMHISDNLGLQSVNSYGLLPYGENFVLIYSEILTETEQGYFLSRPDDQWIYLCDSSNDKCIFPSAVEIENPESDARVFFSLGQLNDDQVMFFLRIENETIEFWAEPINGEDISSKYQYRIKKGDKVQFDYFVINEEGEASFLTGDELQLEGDPVWSLQDFDVLLWYTAMASDFNDNDTISNIYMNENQ